MTFIQPNKTSRSYAPILLVLLLLLAAGSSYLVVLYNRFVNFEHGASAAKARIGSIEAKKTDIQTRLFALLDASKSDALSSGKLVPEKSPEYFEVGSESASKMALEIR